ncbi:MAG TPA: hypothetical protein VFC17_06555, partial [Candidatus Limnocylindrales bacterium]|nr:hypothetical protein [Candidatus Limnocylindrales bacterium]
RGKFSAARHGQTGFEKSKRNSGAVGRMKLSREGREVGEGNWQHYLVVRRVCRAGCNPHKH